MGCASEGKKEMGQQLKREVGSKEGVFACVFKIEQHACMLMDMILGFPGGLVVNNLPAMQETWVPSLGLEDPLEEAMATHSQCSYKENATDRGAWWAMVHEVTKSWAWLK